MLELEDKVNMAFAEGWEDAERGDNLNPFDYDTHPEEWQAYEDGYIKGVMAGYDDGQPTEQDEWRDFDPEC
jgi:hypothetical protein